MEKNIKDYLHLYLGCECIGYSHFKDESTGQNIEVPLKRKIVGVTQYGVELEGGTFSVAYVKPILRPLSDMTEEEKVELFTLNFGNHRFTNFGYDSIECIILADKDERIRVGLSSNSMGANAFLFCLTRGFDLFGLLESGLAINANSTPTPHGSTN
jgi:hypothetical protein